MRAKNFTAIFFLSVLLVLICLVFAGIVRRATEKLTTSDDESAYTVVHIDWEKLYPFDIDAPYEPEPQKSSFDVLQEKITKYTSTKMPGRYTIVETAKAYEELIGWNMVSVSDYNPVIKLDDGYLFGLAASNDVSEKVEAVKGLDEFCRENGIEYMYINLPVKVCQSEDTYVSGFLEYSNQNADRFLDAIGKAGVKYYDFRKILHADGMNHHEAFFRTDHHWKPETGLWAARHILQFLRDDYGWSVDPEILKPENFEHKIYPEWFLGSQGKKLTLARTKPDDFTMLYPKFPTLIRFEIPSLGINTSGDFAITYDMRFVEHLDYYKLNSYAAYKYADKPLDLIHNLLNHNGKKILVIHESMSNCVIPFIALGVEYTDDIDLRHFKGSLRSYIKASKPDMVITSYFSEVTGWESKPSNPRKSIYDFR